MCYYTNGFYEANFHYRLNGNTVIDGQNGYKMYWKFVNQQSGVVISDYTPAGVAIERDGRVDVVMNNSRMLLCDINMQVGGLTPDKRWVVPPATRSM